MNKKGFIGLLLIFGLILLVIVIFVAYLNNNTNTSYQHGTSRDVVMGYDKGAIWYHLYLKNDHLTAYCFDNESFIPILDESQKEQKDVLVTYEKYLFRGALCTASEKYETVVIKSVELEK